MIDNYGPMYETINLIVLIRHFFNWLLSMCLPIQNYLVSCKKKRTPTKAAGIEGMVLLIGFETPQFDTI